MKFRFPNDTQMMFQVGFSLIIEEEYKSLPVVLSFHFWFTGEA